MNWRSTRPPSTVLLLPEEVRQLGGMVPPRLLALKLR